MTQISTGHIRLGLRENWRQFTLLVIVNAFVGAMVGLERTVMPLIAEEEFGLVSRTVILSFLISFGVVKALANLFAGRLGDRIGRKSVLVFGWLVGWIAGSISHHSSPQLGVGDRRQCPAWCKPGLVLVDYRYHENRLGWP